MDEPFSGLDRQLRGNVRDETLAVLRETRATCIIVTHDPEEAMRLADRIALMRQGKIVQIGRAEDLYKHPADLFTARFFSEFNEFAATVVGQRVPTPVGDFAANGFAAGAEVDVCIRPQGVRVMPAGQGIAGRVLRRRFLGDLDLVEIAVEGLDTSLKSRVPGGIDIAVGNEAGIEIDPAEVLIFERATPTGE
jgi:iron(III) transport system ATP-binding protein